MIFLSDHGFRQYAFSKSSIGETELNLPFLFLLLPKWFQDRFPALTAHARHNAHRLVSTYDIHKTLQHLLHLQTNASEWNNDFPDADGNVSTTGISLLTEIPLTRTCEQAGIPDMYCTCLRLEELNISSVEDKNVKVAQEAGQVIVKTINEALKPHLDICFEWKFQKLVKVKKKQQEDKFMIRIEAVAGGGSVRGGGVSGVGDSGGGVGNGGDKQRLSSSSVISGLFEGWVERTKNDDFQVKLTEISRQNRYGLTSACILKRAFSLKEYCLCRVF